jgi:hypothetical protein
MQCWVVDAKFIGERVGDFDFNGGLSNGIAAEGGVGFTGCFKALECHEALALPRYDKFRVVDEAHAMLGCKPLGTGADEIDVRRLLEDEASGLDGIAEALDAGDTASAEVGAVHKEGVQLDAAITGEEGALTGVEGVVVFHAGNGSLDGVDGGTAAGERGPSNSQGCGYASFVRCDSVVGHSPGTAVDEEDGLHSRSI